MNVSPIYAHDVIIDVAIIEQWDNVIIFFNFSKQKVSRSSSTISAKIGETVDLIGVPEVWW